MISLPRSGSSKAYGESWGQAISEGDRLAIAHVYNRLQDEYLSVSIIIEGRSLGCVRAVAQASHFKCTELVMVAPPASLAKGKGSWLNSEFLDHMTVLLDSWWTASDLETDFLVADMLLSISTPTTIFASGEDELFGSQIVVCVAYKD